MRTIVLFSLMLFLSLAGVLWLQGSPLTAPAYDLSAPMARPSAPVGAAAQFLMPPDGSGIDVVFGELVSLN